MILRIAAALTLLAGLAAFAAYLHVLGKFPTVSAAAKHLRAMKDRIAAPAAAAATTYAAMAALPKYARLSDYGAFEQHAVTIEGYAQRVARAPDDDIHLELVPVPRTPGESGLPYVTAEVTPEWRRGSSTWSYSGMLEAFHPNRGGVTAWEDGTRRARITGWLLYDYEYEGAPEFGPPRLSAWELHPVTRIELWNDSLRAYVDDPR